MEESFQLLLQEVLTRLCRCRDTPLQFGIDGQKLVGAAGRSLRNGAPAGEAGELQDPELAEITFGELVERALDERRPPEARARAQRREAPQASGGRDGASIPEPTGEEATRSLGAWVERLYTVLRGAHPRALDVVALRVEGCTVREIAGRLGLGLRLVRRILRDARRAWEEAAQEEGMHARHPRGKS